MAKLINDHSTRREFLKFMGRTGLKVSAISMATTQVACADGKEPFEDRGGDGDPNDGQGVTPLKPSFADELKMSEGFDHEILISWGDLINDSGDTFGFNNDFIQFIPMKNKNEALLWVNHEYVDPFFVSNHRGEPKTIGQVETEMDAVGGSFIKIEKNKNNQWEVVTDSTYARKVTAKTDIPLISERAIQGSSSAMGTLANCAGGFTPWGNVLTCEENYQYSYGEVSFDENGVRTHDKSRAKGLQWINHYDNPPEHYGWVVEINPATGASKKLTALGRFSHESATCVGAKDGRTVVYSGDDATDQCLYKFIAKDADSLERGTLYVAKLADNGRGEWIPLDVNSNADLKAKFKDQTELLIRTREAAHMVGGTKLDRPEDIAVDPLTGGVFIALTNNKPKGDYFGSIMKIVEDHNDPKSLTFDWSTFATGGKSFACPDNLCFDSKGHLWMTSDMSGSDIAGGRYDDIGNNGLYYIPTYGKAAGRVYRIASAPVDAEFTGPCFSTDEKTLFLAVQHPGERTRRVGKMTSHWPGGTKKDIPKPSVVAITGKKLEELVQKGITK